MPPALCGPAAAGGVEVWFAPYINSVAQLLEQRGKLYDTILFCRHYIAAPYMARIREWAPQARIVFDTVDLHYLREQRLAEASQVLRARLSYQGSKLVFSTEADDALLAVQQAKCPGTLTWSVISKPARR